jgi:hypothetical protein
MDTREHLTMLLEYHDGDDRCGCLTALVADLVDDAADLDSAVTRVSTCLADHPAGITLRTTFNRSHDDH